MPTVRPIFAKSEIVNRQGSVINARKHSSDVDVDLSASTATRSHVTTDFVTQWYCYLGFRLQLSYTVVEQKDHGLLIYQSTGAFTHTLRWDVMGWAALVTHYI